MGGEWNKENWFDLAYYAELYMDACYEQSIVSSDGYAASRDLSPNPEDRAANRVDEGSLSPTTYVQMRNLIPQRARF